ncbi:MAG TPA: phage major capsid protein [Gallionella sp.]|nr:phage major capsid protein [Gallionella sp.]
MSQELKAAIEEQGRAWEEFKKANDARLSAIEGKAADAAPADLIEKVGTINADISKLSSDIEQIMKEKARAAISKDAEGKQRTPEQVEYKQALVKFMRTGEESGLRALEAKAMNMGSDPNGGYLVDEEMDSTIIRIAQTMSALPRLARVVTIGSPQWEKLVKTSGMSMRRVAEGQTGGETTEPTYAKIQIPVYEAEVEPWVYNATLDDAFVDLEADLMLEAGIGFAEGSANEFINGNGVGKSRGILSYTNVANASYVFGKVGYIPSGKAGAFASVAPSDALINLQHALKAQYRPGARFLMSDSTLGVARQMKDASGSYYLWQPDTTAGFGGRFLGSPVEIDDNMPVIAANSFSIAYGDFSQAYAIVNRAGTSLIRDNITAKGTTKFNFRRRFGGGVVNFEAIKLMKYETS